MHTIWGLLCPGSLLGADLIYSWGKLSTMEKTAWNLSLSAWWLLKTANWLVRAHSSPMDWIVTCAIGLLVVAPFYNVFCDIGLSTAGSRLSGYDYWKITWIGFLTTSKSPQAIMKTKSIHAVIILCYFTRWSAVQQLGQFLRALCRLLWLRLMTRVWLGTLCCE